MGGWVGGKGIFLLLSCLLYARRLLWYGWVGGWVGGRAAQPRVCVCRFNHPPTHPPTCRCLFVRETEKKRRRRRQSFLEEEKEEEEEEEEETTDHNEEEEEEEEEDEEESHTRRKARWVFGDVY